MARCLIKPKAGHNESFHIWRHRAFNLQTKTCMGPNGDILDLTDLYKICGPLVDLKTHTVALLQSLNLTYEETVLLGCLPILSPDRASEASREMLERTHWAVTKALYSLILQNHASPAVVFGHCVRVLSEERTVTATIRDNQEDFWREWGDKIPFPSLMLEMIT